MMMMIVKIFNILFQQFPVTLEILWQVTDYLSGGECTMYLDIADFLINILIEISYNGKYF